MIDSKSAPIEAPQPGPPTLQLDGSTALMFNTLAVGAITLAALIPIGIAAHWAQVSVGEVNAGMGFGPAVMPDLALGTRLGAMGLSLAAVAPLAWGLLRLRNCFAEFALGRPFAARGIAGLRDFAAGMALSVLAKPASHTLVVLLLSANAPVGQRQLAVRLEGDVLMMALFAATIASLGWAMQKAAAIAEENSQFI